MHLACFMVFWTGVDSLALLLCAVSYFVRMFGITAGYHRYFSHRAYKTSRVFQFFLACLGCSALQKGPLWWAGHHRHHHRYSDSEGDPHSPLQGGFLWSHVGWILTPDYEARPAGVIRDFERYPELRWLDRWYWTPGIALALLCFALDGWTGLAWGFFISTVLLYHGTFTVNSLCHLFGRRRYQTEDDSRNNLLVALITLGEGWHNNHHHYQGSANQGFFWWEIDMSYYILRGLQTIGLVRGLRKPPRKKIRPEPTVSLAEDSLAVPPPRITMKN